MTSWLRWSAFSADELAALEDRLLSVIKTPLTYLEVPIPTTDGTAGVWTIHTCHTPVGKPPLVLVHGFGAGVGLWLKNLDALAEHYTVYAFDLLGFGRSSRPAWRWGQTPEEAEHWWVESIEQWRAALGLTPVFMMGHSLGGFLAGCYALAHPEHVHHLVLLDPAGVPPRPDVNNEDFVQQLPLRRRIFYHVLKRAWGTMSPFNVLRWAGPLGPTLVAWFRRDLRLKFVEHFEDTSVPRYIYMLNAGAPSGEDVFLSLFQFGAWAVRPLMDRIQQCAVPHITFVYGEWSWMDPSAGLRCQRLLAAADRSCNVFVVNGAGHHVYADQPEHFHQLLASVAQSWDLVVATGAATATTTTATTTTTTTTTAATTPVAAPPSAAGPVVGTAPSEEALETAAIHHVTTERLALLASSTHTDDGDGSEPETFGLLPAT